MALDPERVDELFSAFGPVTCRRMFGGSGVYAGGVIFAIEIQGVLHLKSDASTDDAFEREGCEPFSYDTKEGRRIITSYRRAPERLLEDPDEMAEWARRSLEVSRKAQAAKKPAKKPARRRKPA